MIEVNRLGEVVQIKLSREDGGRPLYWTAAYLVDGLLIDTGCAYTTQELVRFLESQPEGSKVRLAVNTHHHEDHVGANRLLQDRFGVEIFAHPRAVPVIGRRPRLEPYREFVWGYPEPSQVSPLGNTVRTARFRFDVIETPGHCDGHVALLERDQGWCFSGDLYVGSRPKAMRPDEDAGELVRSMERLAAAGPSCPSGGAGGDLGTPDFVLFAGTGRVIEDGRRALLECAAYLRDLGSRAKKLAGRGLEPAAIRDELLGRESVLARLTNGHYSAENLIRGLVSADL